MSDDLIRVLAIIGMLFIAGYRGSQRHVMAQFYWSVVAILFLVPASIIMTFNGQYSRAGKTALVLLVFLVMTGFVFECLL